MVALGNISGWQPSDGPVTTWMASPAAREAARAARRSDTTFDVPEGPTPPEGLQRQGDRQAASPPDGRGLGHSRRL